MSLTSCEKADTSPYGLGKRSAKAVKAEIHNEYLQCYALQPKNKKQCVFQLNKKYLKKHSSDQEYRLSFQYEAEKLGFKHFLTRKKLRCNDIKDGPNYENKHQAYLVKCGSNQNYLMQFDYYNKEWSLKK